MSFVRIVNNTTWFALTDISNAFRTLRWREDFVYNWVYHLDDDFFVDSKLYFGPSPGPRVFQRVSSLFLKISLKIFNKNKPPSKQVQGEIYIDDCLVGCNCKKVLSKFLRSLNENEDVLPDRSDLHKTSEKGVVILKRLVTRISSLQVF